MICPSCEKEVSSVFDGICGLCWMSNDDNLDEIGGDAWEALAMAFGVVAKLKTEADALRAKSWTFQCTAKCAGCGGETVTTVAGVRLADIIDSDTIEDAGNE